MSSHEEDSDATSQAPHEPPKPPRRIRHIQPVGPRVLIRLKDADERSPGGLYLPQGVAEKHVEALYGEVVEVARANPEADTLGKNVSGIPAGADVLFDKEAGFRIPWEPALRLVETRDILAVVEELDYEDAH